MLRRVSFFLLSMMWDRGEMMPCLAALCPKQHYRTGRQTVKSLWIQEGGWAERLTDWLWFRLSLRLRDGRVRLLAASWVHEGPKYNAWIKRKFGLFTECWKHLRLWIGEDLSECVELGHDRFLPHPFQFIALQSFCRISLSFMLEMYRSAQV
jgi:hypothetical protein